MSSSLWHVRISSLKNTLSHPVPHRSKKDVQHLVGLSYTTLGNSL